MSDLSAPPRPCPDPAVLAAYVEGKLDDSSRREVERHVADCPECPIVVAETVHFLRNDGDDAESEVDPPSRGPWWQLAAAIAALCVMGVVWQEVVRRDPLRRVKEIASDSKMRTVEGQLVGFDYAPFDPVRSAHEQEANLALQAEAERLEDGEPPNAQTLHARGVTMLLVGDVPAAVSLLEAASRNAPADAEISSDLAVVHITGHRFPLALAAADDAIARSPSLASAHFNRGVALEHLGRREQAVSAYQRAMELEPSRSAWRKEIADRIARLKS